MTIALSVLAIVAGFVVLIWGGDHFIDGAADIASNFGVSPLIIGLTIVGFGTSAPEMLVSALASIDGVPSLGIGNALGSNIANVGMVLGITILITPLAISSETLNREFTLLASVMGLALLLLWDLFLGHVDGVVLFSSFIFTICGMAYLAIRSSNGDSLKQEYLQPKITACRAIVSFMIGLTALLIGSKSLVWGAVGVATLLGISELIVGLTIVAIGTSLPELVASIISALKNRHDIAVGNVLGSNIFNILAVLAMPGLIYPSTVNSAIIERDYPFMVVLFLMLYMFSCIGNKGHLSRLAGSSLLFVYIAYNALLAYQETIGMSV